MGKAFSTELDQVGDTLAWSSTISLPERTGSQLTYGSCLVAIGSGGSFSGAEFAARLHQWARSAMAIALTPLDYASRASRLGNHAAVLLSAEGKNSDIRNAATCALRFANSVNAVTFTTTSQLLQTLSKQQKALALDFDAPWVKDGYLATNSLIATVVILSRIYGLEIDIAMAAELLPNLRAKMGDCSAVRSVASGRRVLVLHGVLGTVAAIDLESKFAEAALGTVQRADLRQFAHGRHIQLVDGPDQFAIIAFIAPEDAKHWVAVRRLLPEQIPIIVCVLPPGLADSTLHGLLFGFSVVEAVGTIRGGDPGQPVVPPFARQLHSIVAADYAPLLTADVIENRKVRALLLSGQTNQAIWAAATAFIGRLLVTRIRGLVLDFDGTCCETQHRLSGMHPALLHELKRLLSGNIPVAFATGRGDSLYKELRKRLDPTTWHLVLLGCHSGSTMLRLSDAWVDTTPSGEFSTVTAELMRRGIANGNDFKLRARSEQFTIECGESLHSTKAFLAASELVQTRSGWRAFQSSHSVDILTAVAGKSHVVDWMAKEFGLEQNTEILRIGDRGECFGNDTELLSGQMALSVEGVSTDLQSCWLFGNPRISGVERALTYLCALDVTNAGYCRFAATQISAWLDLIKNEVVNPTRADL